MTSIQAISAKQVSQLGRPHFMHLPSATARTLRSDKGVFCPVHARAKNGFNDSDGVHTACGNQKKVKRDMTTEEFLDRDRERKLDVIRREYEREKKILDLPIVTREVFRRANAYKTALDAAEGKPTSKEWAEEALTFLYEEYAYYSTCLDLSENMEWAEEYQEREELISFMIALIERDPIGSHAIPCGNGSGERNL